MRRVDRLILGSPTVFRTITALNLVGRQDSKIVRDWMLQFAPGLRYSNPTLICELRAPKRIVTDGVESAEGAASTDNTKPSDAAGEVEAQAPAEDSGEAGETANGDGEEEEPSSIELLFNDGSRHVMNLALYRQSHQVMQRILELDAEKGLSSS